MNTFKTMNVSFEVKHYSLHFKLLQAKSQISNMLEHLPQQTLVYSVFYPISW